ncbi:MAG: hypothetical protein EOO47_06605 [Flavobacterium sp.]|nr:MAG: hypothetical protein EOO47_06605 [Flavobacterium sp.]
MKPWVVVFSKLPAQGMAIFPFIFVKRVDLRENIFLINHERIHFKQQLELLLVFFYILYLFNYLINLVKYRNHHSAYMNICFEKEAYHHEKDLNYLTNRKLFNWINFYSA